MIIVCISLRSWHSVVITEFGSNDSAYMVIMIRLSLHIVENAMCSFQKGRITE